MTVACRDAGGSTDNKVPFTRRPCTFGASRTTAAPAVLATRARTVAQLPEIQNKASAQHKQELRTMTAHSVPQLRGASVATCPSFLAESWQTSGGSRVLRHSPHGSCEIRRHRYGTK
jgi:hypothetical protein